MNDRAPNGNVVPYDLDKRHVATATATGTLAAVIRMLIEEFGAEGRGDWLRTLNVADAHPA